MKIRFSYPVETGVATFDRWPICLGDLEFEWLGEGEKISSVAVTVPASEADILPTVLPNPQPGIAMEINGGQLIRAGEVEQALRVIQGLADLFGRITIDFEHGKVDWIPESKEEELKLPLRSFSHTSQPVDLRRPRLATYDLLARSVAAARAASDHEIPLSFLRRGTRDMNAKKYIEAFYNLFFFLETLYAPGYSDPRKVKKMLKEAAPVIVGLGKMREKLVPEIEKEGPELRSLLAMSDADLIDHLVNTRGNLHHHAPRKPGAWHPDKPNKFRSEANVLFQITHEIATGTVLPILFTQEQDTALFTSAERANAVVDLRVEIKGTSQGEPQTIQPLTLRFPGKRVHRPMIEVAFQQTRRIIQDHLSHIEVTDFQIVHPDGKQIYAKYQRIVS